MFFHILFYHFFNYSFWGIIIENYFYYCSFIIYIYIVNYIFNVLYFFTISFNIDDKKNIIFTITIFHICNRADNCNLTKYCNIGNPVFIVLVIIVITSLIIIGSNYNNEFPNCWKENCSHCIWQRFGKLLFNFFQTFFFLHNNHNNCRLLNP